jgi:hypothetical protein
MRGNRPLRKQGIIDCVAFYEVFLCISPKNLLGDFFYSLNRLLRGGALLVDRDSIVSHSGCYMLNPLDDDRMCSRSSSLNSCKSASSMSP